MSGQSGLTIRQFERRDINLPVEFVVCPEHRTQVQFHSTSGAKDQHVLTGQTIDVSAGGIGLSMNLYVPRQCAGTLRIFNPKPIGAGSDGQPIHQIAFEHEVRIRRVDLTSPDPTYFLGTAFIDPEPDIGNRIIRLLEQVDGSEASNGAGANLGQSESGVDGHG